MIPTSPPETVTEQLDQEKRHEDTALVPLLLLMTMVTGIVDAVSILRLGHVFVANMTGNVVFLGFALAGASGFSISASLVALAAFLAGAAAWGRIPTAGRKRSLARTAAFEAVVVAAATAVAIAAHGSGERYVMTILLAVAMGAQNVTVRRLAVPDMTTTVLTLTITGLAADPPDLAKPNSYTTRRLAAVASMLTGAVAGAIIVLHSSTEWALGAATALLSAAAIAARIETIQGPGRRAKAPRTGVGRRAHDPDDQDPSG